MAALGRAATSDDVLIWEHGRRFGIGGDGQSGDPSFLMLDGKVIGSNRLTGGSTFIKAVTGLSAAGAVTLTGAAVGDVVVSVTNLTTPGDASSSFETTITVANQIQETASVSGATVLVVLSARS